MNHPVFRDNVGILSVAVRAAGVADSAITVLVSRNIEAHPLVIPCRKFFAYQQRCGVSALKFEQIDLDRRVHRYELGETLALDFDTVEFDTDLQCGVDRSIADAQ